MSRAPSFGRFESTSRPVGRDRARRRPLFSLRTLALFRRGDFDAVNGDFRGFQWFQPSFYPLSGLIFQAGDLDLDDIEFFLNLMVGTE